MTTTIINDSMFSNQPLVFCENLSASKWKECDRAMWLGFRNCSDVKHKPEALRTFQLGHKIEDMVVQWLKDAGFKISHQQGKLTNKWGKYLGSIDGIILHEKTYKLLEIKSANGKRFKEWLKNGIPEYYKAQTSIYMHKSAQLSTRGNKLNQCLFVVLNKDTSEIHTEVYDYDQKYAQLQVDRIENVIESESVPNADESYQCAWCDHKQVCKGETVSQISCRSCAHVSVVNGDFECVHGYGKICNNFVFHPQLVELLGYNFESIDNEIPAIVYDKFAMAAEGATVPGKATFTASEFVMAHQAGMVHDDGLLGIKDICGATILEINKNEH